VLIAQDHNIKAQNFIWNCYSIGGEAAFNKLADQANLPFGVGG
tara:strand:- start:31443 stop:31571 length:129 start_codon:yes stop_codon:yes gene_type:complete